MRREIRRGRPTVFLLAAAVTLLLGLPFASPARPLQPTSGIAWAARGTYSCDPSYQRLGVDFVNDDTPAPRAFSLTDGVLEPGGVAQFRVYGIREGDLYYDITQAFSNTYRHPRSLQVRVRAARGSRSVAGTFRYSETAPPRLVYTPKRKMRVDRSAIVTFAYRCNPPLKQEFTLHIPASR